MHTARDQNNGENLNLQDEKLRLDQIYTRQKQNKSTHSEAKAQEQIKVGDTVALITKQDKHKARDVFLVTGTEYNKVQTQKILNPLSNKKTHVRNIQYRR